MKRVAKIDLGQNWRVIDRTDKDVLKVYSNKTGREEFTEYYVDLEHLRIVHPDWIKDITPLDEDFCLELRPYLNE